MWNFNLIKRIWIFTNHSTVQRVYIYDYNFVLLLTFTFSYSLIVKYRTSHPKNDVNAKCFLYARYFVIDILPKPRIAH